MLQAGAKGPAGEWSQRDGAMGIFLSEVKAPLAPPPSPSRATHLLVFIHLCKAHPDPMALPSYANAHTTSGQLVVVHIGDFGQQPGR